MGATAVGMLITLALVVLALWLGGRLARRLGLTTPRDLPTRTRWRVRVLLGVMMFPSLVAAWAIVTGRPAVAIAVLVGVFVLPQLVLTPLRIRWAQRQAAEARERRRQRAR